MASSKRTIKKRFKMIKAYEVPKLHIKIISVLLAISLSLSGMFVNAIFLSVVAYAEKIPLLEKIEDIIPRKNDEQPTAQSGTIQVGQEIAEHKSVVTVEEEQQVKDSVLEKEEPKKKIKRETTSEEEYVNMDIIDLGEEKNTDTMAELVESLGNSYVKGNFNFEDGSRKIITGIKPDSNGNITLHFTSKANEIIEIGFSETDSKKGVWGVKIPANANRAYSFSGFDKNTEYSISLYSPAKENWKIDSEYIIY